MTKQQKAILKRYNLSNMYDLYDAYDNTSGAKRRARRGVVDEYNDKHGYGLKIIAKNTFMFSVGYYYKIKDVLMFHYETNQTAQNWAVSDEKR